MPKVYCADDGCMYNDDNLCRAKKINLAWHSVVTVWDGRQEFHKCKMRKSPAEYRREQSERSKE